MPTLYYKNNNVWEQLNLLTNLSGSDLQNLRKEMGLGDTLGVLPIENGGTGASTVEQVIENLGLKSYIEEIIDANQIFTASDIRADSFINLKDGNSMDLDSSQSGITNTTFCTCAGGNITFLKTGTYLMSGQIGSYDDSGGYIKDWGGTVWMQFLKTSQRPNKKYGTVGSGTVNGCPDNYSFNKTINITAENTKYYFTTLCVYSSAYARQGYFAVKDLTIIKQS